MPEIGLQTGVEPVDPFAQNPERRYVFIDESGDLRFSEKSSRYFMITSVVLHDYVACHHLLQLRRDMLWEGHPARDIFHAHTDPRPVRQRVFAAMCEHDIRIDCTILEKRKAYPSLHRDSEFYKFATYYHLKHMLPLIGSELREVMVIAASIEMHGKQEELKAALNGTVEQSARAKVIRSAFMPSRSDIGLQIADYCSWAIFRKWEAGSTEFYDLIKHKIRSEFDIFRTGRKLHY